MEDAGALRARRPRSPSAIFLGEDGAHVIHTSVSVDDIFGERRLESGTQQRRMSRHFQQSGPHEKFKHD